MYSGSVAERWPKGKGEAPRRLGLRLMPALASRRPHRVAESQSESRDPRATRDRGPTGPDRRAGRRAGRSPPGTRGQAVDRREARTDMPVILSDRPKQPVCGVLTF
jgi:hypothetical protein